MSKFKGIYNVNSSRAKFWNYAGDGLYFITICTKDKKTFFGEIQNNVLIPTAMGIKAEYYWNQISRQFPFVDLDYFILMPNHLHGIIGINKSQNPQVETRFIACPPPEDPGEQKSPGGITGDKNPMGKGSLGEIIRWYKGRTCFEIRKTNPDFSWQPRYHDHVIRDAQRYDFICNYILHNPDNWKSIYALPPEEGGRDRSRPVRT